MIDNPVVMQAEICPLSGIALVEASAGTGKTYTIQNLFLRMIAEKNLTVDSILVMTFTEAATAELKERIRGILTMARQFLISPESLSGTDRTRVDGLLKYARAEAGDEQILRRIQNALLNFDSAAIYTIHGFCQRMLSEYAFESGLLFNIEIRQEQEILLQRLLNDFIRSFFYRHDPDGLRAELKRTLNFPDKKAFDLIREVVSRPALHVNTGLRGNLSLEAYHQHVEDLLEQIRKQCGEGFLTQALGDIKLNKNALQKHTLDELEKRFNEWRSSRDCSGIIDALKPFYPGTFSGAVNKRQAHYKEIELRLSKWDFLDKAAALENAVNEYGVRLQLAAAEYVRTQFARQKLRENFQTFDDLPNRMLAAVRKEHSPLAAAVRKKFHAAVVDEFQDTDPVQYEIVKRLFAQRENPLLFMVGDPKQAIYSFRGGDIATYRLARRECMESGGVHYVLNRNYRSAGKMIEAVNRIFSTHPDPFVDRAIEFHPVEPGVDETGNVKSGLILPDGTEDPNPLKIFFPGEKTNKDEFKRIAFRNCANDISALLQSGVRTPGEHGHPLRPNDFAVLVFSGNDAAEMRRELTSRRIPCVIPKSGNVYDSDACNELRKVLAAICSPYDSGFAMDAMQTVMLGYTTEDLIRINREVDSGSPLDGVPEKLGSLLEIWRQDSFIEMFQMMLRNFNIREKLLSSAGGERMLTDLLQLRELLHQASCERELSPDSLLHYLDDQCRAERLMESSDEKETLMETDRSAVMITTIHKSKGLEYPVVMLPFLYFRGIGGDPGNYHDENGQLVRDLTESEISKNAVKLEQLQEQMRLIYVALTRAKYSCYLYIADFKNKTFSVDWLFQNPADFTDEEALLDAFMSGNREKELSAYIPEDWFIPENPIECNVWQPTLADIPELRCFEPWGGHVDSNFLFTSFSALVSSRHALDSAVDYDEDGTDNLDDLPNGIFKIPAGRSTGNAWHAILEKLDFTASPSEQTEELIRQKLQQYGVLGGLTADEQQEYVALTGTMMEQVLSAPLETPFGVPFSLRSISRSERLSELQFCYRFQQSFHTAEIAELIADYVARIFGKPCSALREQFVAGGYLNGAVDLMFRHDGRIYLADWKSNRITGKAESFSADALKKEMTEHYYFLQYLIYTVALVKYLSVHLGHSVTESEYEKLFGGVYYFFLRGMDPAIPGQGVFFDRPPFAIIKKLDDLIG